MLRNLGLQAVPLHGQMSQVNMVVSLNCSILNTFEVTLVTTLVHGQV